MKYSFNIKILLLFTLGIIIISSCNIYKRVTPNSTIGYIKMDTYLSIHYGPDVTCLSPIKILDDSIKGQIIYPKKIKKKDVIHLYINEPISNFLIGENTVLLPTSAIETLEIYQKDGGKTALTLIGTFIVFGGIGAILLGILMMFAAPY